jgi:small conductance mechanosensitive channel
LKQGQLSRFFLTDDQPEESKMEEQLAKLRTMGDMIASHGQDVVAALIILVLGLIVAKMLNRQCRRLLGRFNLKPQTISTVSNVFYVVLIITAITMAELHAGVPGVIIQRVFFAAILLMVGIIVIFRPLLPTLPFKVGNTIMTGELLGKVEATNFLNTRIKSFDGKTVFVPNSKILNDYLINYHFTPTRQIRLVIGITYNSDLLKAKKLLADIIAEEPTVLDKPAARVFVLNLAESCVELAVRPWVNNLDYWRTRCDLLEKIKLCFDQGGITIAFPQRDIHLYHETFNTGNAEKETWLSGDKV